ncbi:MAG: IS200/IS605 family transposase [Planctomycetes bacterium]|nr:IS200/IS605 family transposase [Planctomycetota bacterium]
MPQSLTKILLHIVFSTKHRADVIAPEIEPNLHAYLGGICRELDSPLLAVNGTPNHVHMLVNLGRTVSVSELLLNVKRDSSKWMKTKSSSYSDFHWQDGYGAFSISESAVPKLQNYIANQKERHTAMTFENELRALCQKYGVGLDERYAWS